MAAAGGFSSLPSSASGPTQQPLRSLSHPAWITSPDTLGARAKGAGPWPRSGANRAPPSPGGGQPGPAGGSAAFPGRADFLSLTKWRAFQTCAAIGSGARAELGGGGFKSCCLSPGQGERRESERHGREGSTAQRRTEPPGTHSRPLPACLLPASQPPALLPLLSAAAEPASQELRFGSLQTAHARIRSPPASSRCNCPKGRCPSATEI